MIKAQTNTQIENAINQSGFRLKMLYLHNNDSLRVYVRLQNDFKEWQKVENITKNFVFDYYVTQDYKSVKPTATKIIPQQISKEEDGIKFYLQIPRQNIATGILFFEMVNILDNTKYNLDLKINFTNTRLRDEFAVFQSNSLFPCFDGYILQNEVFSVKNIAKKEILLRNFFYKDVPVNTDMALSPMNLTKNTNPQKKTEDIFSISKTNENFSFKDKGLCFFKKDTADFYGLSVRIEDKNFPKIAEKTDLIAALTYILKNNERENFSEIINKKEDKKEDKKESKKEDEKDYQKNKQNEIKQELDKFFL